MALPLPAGTGIVTQLLALAVALPAATLMPPAHGTMVALPLTGTTAAETINLALAQGATVEGTGRGGLVVLRGDRDRLAPTLRTHGVLLLAASPLLCGA